MVCPFFDNHMHTPLCGHAVGSPDLYVAAALAKGLSGVTFTCHSPAPNGYSQHIRMKEGDLDLYYSMIVATKEKFADKIEVLIGLESDYIPGFESFLEKLHSRYDFDFVLGSVHPQLKDYQDLFFKDDLEAFFETYFQHQMLLAETGLVDCIAHCDLFRDYFTINWSSESSKEIVGTFLAKIAKTKVAIEINTSGLIRGHSSVYPALSILEAANNLEIPITLGSDAHSPGRVGDGFPQALLAMQSTGVNSLTRFVRRNPHRYTHKPCI